jgi:hypothetical protein
MREILLARAETQHAERAAGDAGSSRPEIDNINKYNYKEIFRMPNHGGGHGF